MEFRILGPLDITQAGQPVSIGGLRERTILAVLLLEAGHVVPIGRLIDAVWEENPPATARGQVQICISNLRRRFLTVGGADVIDTRVPGYLLRVEEGELDLQVFESRVARAREAFSSGETHRAVAELRAALALWRGPALSGIESAVVRSYVARLDERRVSALGECLDYQLRTGAHFEIIGELAELVKRHPLQERFRVQHMTALYRSGRQAEALEVYRNTRELLAEELGIEPGEELRSLHQAILVGEPAGREEAEEGVAVASPPAPVASQIHPPRLLPADIPDFVGRTDLLDRWCTEVDQAGSVGDRPVWVGAIVGRGGVGKTTLALHLAHLVVPQFPGGQLFARLRDGDQAVNPFHILERFLRALGVSGPALPKGIEERAEIFRDLVGRRRTLIVLDDVMTEQQVSALLPGNARCAVIVTSRGRLTGLPVTSRVEISEFSRGSATELLSRIVGAERVRAEPTEVAEVAALCGHLPLALRIVGARLAARPHWSVADLLERLTDDTRRLDELSHSDLGMRASILVTYERLSEPARLLFQRLALLEAPTFPAWVGAPLLELPVTRAQDVLEELTDAYLLAVEPSGTPGQCRYRFHNLIRPFARERLVEESPEARRAALERWLGALLSLVESAHRSEYGGAFLVHHGGASRWRLPERAVARLVADPLDWFEDERSGIVAAVRQAAATGFVAHAWELALHAVTLFESRSYLGDWLETHEQALDVVCREGDLLGEAAMRYSLGSLFMFERRHEPAAEQLDRARRLYQDLDHSYGVALVLRNMAHLDRVNGDLDSAEARWEKALAAFRAEGDRIAEAYVLQSLAQVRLDYGELAEASGLLGRAVDICQEVGNQRVGAQVMHRLGQLWLRRGDLERAAETFEKVLRAVRGVRDAVGECYALLGLAAVDSRRGDLAAAGAALERARELAALVSDEVAAYRVELALADLRLLSGELCLAGSHADRALAGFQSLRAPLLEVSGLVLRGRIHAAADESDRALRAWRTALATLETLQLENATQLHTELRSHIAGLAGDRQAGPADGRA